MTSAARSRSWTPIAVTGARFAAFAPYVPAVDEAGRVAFQAALVSGGSGVFAGAGGAITDVVATPAVGAVTSHPDLDGAGGTSFYGVVEDGIEAVLVARGGALEAIASTSDGLVGVGPAGPTMNEAGAVAFRADPADGVSGLFLWDGSRVREVAVTGEVWSGFQGLPVVGGDGAVVFRADRIDGGEGIYAASASGLRVVAETGERFASLARFPCLRGDGTVGFAATLPSGAGVAVTDAAGRLEVVDETGAYESFRGVLLTGSAVVRIATPVGCELGLFCGPDPVSDRILAIGDPLLGSTVVDLAANPVSVNASGHLAVRVRLADGREAILHTALQS